MTASLKTCVVPTNAIAARPLDQYVADLMPMVLSMTAKAEGRSQILRLNVVYVSNKQQTNNNQKMAAIRTRKHGNNLAHDRIKQILVMQI
jgi:hypothetical protein